MNFFKKFASGFFVVGVLFGTSLGLSASANESCGISGVGNISDCFDKINGFFRSCGKKVKIENEKLAEALGWFSTGVAVEGAAIGLVKGICALAGREKKGNEVKSGDVFDITTRATVTLKGKDINAKKDVKYSKSDIKSKDSSLNVMLGPNSSSGDRAVDGASKVGVPGSNKDILKVVSGSSNSIEGSSKFGSNSYKDGSSSRFMSGVVVPRFSSNCSCRYPSRSGLNAYIMSLDKF